MATARTHGLEDTIINKMDSTFSNMRAPASVLTPVPSRRFSPSCAFARGVMQVMGWEVARFATTQRWRQMALELKRCDMLQTQIEH